MLRIRNALGLAIIMAFFVSCGPYESSFELLALDIDGDEVPSDGETVATLVIRAVHRNEPVPDRTRISVSATAGTFVDANGRDQSSPNLSTIAGEATVGWRAPYPFEGPVTVTASYIDPYREQQEAKLDLLVVDPAPVDGATFRFWCSAENTQRPRASDPPLRIPCTIEARDIDGRDVKVDDVKFGFLAETGRFEFDRNGKLEWVLSPGERPKRVEPLGDWDAGEPRWHDQNAGFDRNPRDGIATLVVHTRGMPTGTQDPLHGDPYVDENDNGMWDPGEPYFDSDKTGRYDGPTGDTGPRRIYRWYKIMITGPVSQTAPEHAEGIELWDTGSDYRQNIRINRGQEKSIGLLLLDENLNPVASHWRTNPDTVRLLGAEPRREVSVNPEQQSLVADATGLSFDPLTGMILAGESRTGYLQGDLTYRFRIRNEREWDEGDDEPTGPIDWSLGAVEIKRTPFPGVNTTITERLDGHELPRGYLD